MRFAIDVDNSSYGSCLEQLGMVHSYANIRHTYMYM